MLWQVSQSTPGMGEFCAVNSTDARLTAELICPVVRPMGVWQPVQKLSTLPSVASLALRSSAR
ncbi:hypothetical protein D3C76_1323160 [compost metagenome]